MATITRYVDPNAAAGGDGTTNGLSGSTCAYASMSIWEAAQQQDLTDAGGDIAECICDSNGGAADTTAVTINGWTTSTTSYIWIHTPAASRHDGKWNTGKFRIAPSSGGGIVINEEFVRIDGLQVSINDAFAAAIHIDTAGSNGEWIISNSILRGAPDGLRGIYAYHAGTGIKIYNVIAYDFTSFSNAGGIVCNVVASSVFYNNTVVGCTTGIIGGNGSNTAKNNLLRSCTTAASGTFAAGTDYNATDNASMGYTVTGGGNTHDRTSQTFMFVNEAGDDFHLASSDAGAKDFGVSDPGSGLFSDDIDGQMRSGSWDIGADEVITASAGFPFPSNPMAHMLIR